MREEFESEKCGAGFFIREVWGGIMNGERPVGRQRGEELFVNVSRASVDSGSLSTA